MMRVGSLGRQKEGGDEGSLLDLSSILWGFRWSHITRRGDDGLHCDASEGCGDGFPLVSYTVGISIPLYHIVDRYMFCL